MPSGTSRPGTVGRALGIGLRLLAARVQPAPPTPEQKRAAAEQRVAQAERLGRGARKLGRSSRDLGRSVWNPFAHAGSILWLETTGLFFLLFTLFFAQHMWLLRSSYRSGTEHAHFLTYAVCTVLFGWFAFSSFARARRRARKRTRAGR